MIVEAIKCYKCGDTVCSHNHEIVVCKCQSIAIDSGRYYTKFMGNLSNIQRIKLEIPEGCKRNIFLQKCDNHFQWGKIV